jgi:hypothetical protein
LTERLQNLVRSLILQAGNEISSKNEKNRAAPPKQQQKLFSPPETQSSFHLKYNSHSTGMSQLQPFQFHATPLSFSDAFSPQQYQQPTRGGFGYYPPAAMPFVAEANPTGFGGHFSSLPLMQQQQQSYQSVPQGALLLSTGQQLQQQQQQQQQSMIGSGGGGTSSVISASDVTSSIGCPGSRQVSSQGCSRVFIVKGNAHTLICLFRHYEIIYVAHF